MPRGLPFCLQDYIELVDIRGRAIREDKRGHIDQSLPPILQRLNISADEWLTLTTQFESRFRGLVGAKHQLKKAAKALGLKRLPHLANCHALLH